MNEAAVWTHVINTTWRGVLERTEEYIQFGDFDEIRTFTFFPVPERDSHDFTPHFRKRETETLVIMERAAECGTY